MEKILDIIIKFKNKTHTKTFRKNVYEYYKIHNYTNSALTDLSNVIDVEFSKLRECIYDYAKKEYGMTSIQFDKFKKEEQEKNNDIYIKVKNFILEEIGIETLFLWTNDKEKEYFLKKLYELLSRDNCTLENLEKISKNLNINTAKCLTLLELARDTYYIKDTNDYKHMIDMQRSMKKRKQNVTLVNCYEAIANAKTGKEVEEIAKKYNRDINYVKRNFYLYSQILTSEQNIKIEEALKKYDEYRKEEKKKLANTKSELNRIKALNKLKEESTRMITKFLEDPSQPLSEFLNKNNIDRNQFNKYLETIYVFNEELHKKYSTSVSEIKLEREERENKILEKIVDGLANGYKEDEEIRNFDILDYFTITRIPLFKMNNLSNRLNKDDRTLIRKFITKFADAEDGRPVHEENIRKTAFTTSARFDEEKNEIPGTRRDITEEEKESMIKYLKTHDMPINFITFNAVKNRYLDGFVKFEPIKSKEEIQRELKELATKIQRGIIENGKLRKFDILDYYDITDIPLSKINDYLKDNVTPSDERIIKKFKRLHIDADATSENQERQIYNEVYRYGVEFDNYGRLIENSGKVITDKEKQIMIDYLKSKGIKVNMTTYIALRNRYVKGLFTIDEDKKVLVLTNNEQ